MMRAPPEQDGAAEVVPLAGEEERQRREERALIATLRIDAPSRLERRAGTGRSPRPG